MGDFTEFECTECCVGPGHLKVHESEANIERMQCPIQGDAEWKESTVDNWI